MTAFFLCAFAHLLRNKIDGLRTNCTSSEVSLRGVLHLLFDPLVLKRQQRRCRVARLGAGPEASVSAASARRTWTFQRRKRSRDGHAWQKLFGSIGNHWHVLDVRKNSAATFSFGVAISGATLVDLVTLVLGTGP